MATSPCVLPTVEAAAVATVVSLLVFRLRVPIVTPNPPEPISPEVFFWLM